VLAPAAAGSVLHHPTDESAAADVGTLVELGDAVHWSGFCFFILWKVFAFVLAFALVLCQAAIC
jgi:hypothetical protein